MKELSLIYDETGNSHQATKITIHQNEFRGFELRTIQALTVAICNDQPGSFIAGYSACSEEDEYDVNLGIIKAVGKCKSKERITGNSPADVLGKVLKRVKQIERRNRQREGKELKDCTLRVNGKDVMNFTMDLSSTSIEDNTITLTGKRK